MNTDTIYALSSGRPPAAIAVVRISGPAAGESLRRLARAEPIPRRATVAVLRDPASGDLLDRALLLWMPGPDSVTGEDLAELHLHGGRAVVDAVLSALGTMLSFREARPGEFTRRAFDNGRIDLNEAEGLADLLAAETDGQRRAALLAAGGVFSRRVEAWREQLLAISAAIEAEIEFADEGDVSDKSSDFVELAVERLAGDISALINMPSADRLKDGIRVVVAGPPNAGKSSLVNAIARRDAAITSRVAGTTRDVIEVPLILGGHPVILVDTAGLRVGEDEVEAEGVARASREMATADILIWLGDEMPPRHANVIAISPKEDCGHLIPDRLAVSSKTGRNIDVLVEQVSEVSRKLLPPIGEFGLNKRQSQIASQLLESLCAIVEAKDPIIQAEETRLSLAICDRLSGRAGVEEMLDALFARFCIGK